MLLECMGDLAEGSRVHNQRVDIESWDAFGTATGWENDVTQQGAMVSAQGFRPFVLNLELRSSLVHLHVSFKMLGQQDVVNGGWPKVSAMPVVGMFRGDESHMIDIHEKGMPNVLAGVFSPMARFHIGIEPADDGEIVGFFQEKSLK